MDDNGVGEGEDIHGIFSVIIQENEESRPSKELLSLVEHHSDKVT